MDHDSFPTSSRSIHTPASPITRTNAGGCKHRERRRLRLQRPEGQEETNGEVGKCNEGYEVVTYN